MKTVPGSGKFKPVLWGRGNRAEYGRAAVKPSLLFDTLAEGGEKKDRAEWRNLYAIHKK